MASIICFDIGIKNLAYCFLKQVGEKYEILSWENVNLLTADQPQTTQKQLCYGCKQKASYEGNSCARHAPRPVLTDLSGNKILKFPAAATLREILIQKEPIFKKTSTKDQILEALRKHYSLPLQKIAVTPKAVGVDLSFLHDCIRGLILKHKDSWHTATEICLENQPAFKNPQMKSVQMMLFATLRDILQPGPPPIRLVHAGMKVKGAAAGDEGYKERKKGSEDRVKDVLSKVLDPRGLIKTYETASKKNDLADAFCMAVDALKKRS
jgi:hypothetical protein